jgi:hypothetical protein
MQLISMVTACVFSCQGWLDTYACTKLTRLCVTQVFPLDDLGDCVKLLRHLSEVRLEAPIWRRHRPHLLIEGATFEAISADESETVSGRLHIDAYVRAVPLSANQLVTVPSGGDFCIECIRAAPELVPSNGLNASSLVVSNSVSSEGPKLLAAPDENRYACASSIECLVRFHTPCLWVFIICEAMTNHKWISSF